MTRSDFSLSVVVAAYNEEEVIEDCHRKLLESCREITQELEFIYVDDGSSDLTFEKLSAIADKDEQVSVIRLSRNYGKELAMTAGLDQSCGDAVVVIDADLQDPPELIATFVEHWQQGYDVVYGQRAEREGETWLKKKTASIFYRVINGISKIDIPRDTGDFRLMSRRSVDALLTLRERNRFMKGLFAWVGYPQKAVRYTRHPRFAGTTKWNYRKLLSFAMEGITSFSTVPLKISSYFGLFVAIAAFLYGVFIIFKTLMFGDPVAGFPTLMVAILFLGGVQLIAIGVLGEYIGRMFEETKGRPLYLISEMKASALKSQQLESY